MTGNEWLTAGFALWEQVEPKERDCFLPRPAVDLTTFSRGAATVGDMAAANYRAFLELKVPEEEAQTDASSTAGSKQLKASGVRFFDEEVT